MNCDIDGKYQLLGGLNGFLGSPLDGMHQTPDGLGFYRHYQNGSIYCHETGFSTAHEIHGLIRQRWAGMGWERSVLGFPTTDEQVVGTGRISFFERGAILYRSDIGTFELHGAIFQRWQALGQVGGLGFPLTDELVTPDGRGRYNHFERGSIYWTPERGAWEVTGGIKDAWAGSGWERSPVGYPLAGPGRTPGTSVDFQDFERGSIYASGPDAKIFAPASHGVLATNENIINWSSFSGRLADGDMVSLSQTTFFPSIGTNLTLTAGPTVTWWKAISLYSPGRGDFQEIFVDRSKRSASTRIAANAFDGGNVYLHFKKAKAFGVHTGMYLLPRPDRMIGTNTTFTWIAD